MELISQNAAYGGVSLYSDPSAVLGEPTRIAVSNDPFIGTSPFYVKIVDPALNYDPAGNKVITTLGRKSDGAGGLIYGSITVKFDSPVIDDSANPYGIDLNVFGNSFYVGSGFVNDTTDMRSYSLMGGIFAEPVLISVSPDNENWYTYSAGPFGDTAFPTQGYEWSADQHDATGNGWTTTQTDFTKPVNPSLDSVLGVQSMSAADAMGTYVGSGGGTGIDLAESGFGWIQYVRVQSAAPPFLNGEIDAFADVRPMRIGEALSITPANVTANTRLHFQSTENESHTAVLAGFSSVSDLAKLATAAVTDSVALAALSDVQLLASYQLHVLPLIGAAPIDFTADYELSPGEAYSGDGSDLGLFQWDGAEWNPIAFAFDALTGRLTLADWADPSTTLAVAHMSLSEPSGDFNGDGHVDAADYVAWRKGAGVPSTEPYYNIWRTDFGTTAGGGAAAANSFTVPEPMAVAVAALAVFGGLSYRRRAA